MQGPADGRSPSTKKRSSAAGRRAAAAAAAAAGPVVKRTSPRLTSIVIQEAGIAADAAEGQPKDPERVLQGRGPAEAGAVADTAASAATGRTDTAAFAAGVAKPSAPDVAAQQAAGRVAEAVLQDTAAAAAPRTANAALRRSPRKLRAAGPQGRGAVADKREDATPPQPTVQAGTVAAAAAVSQPQLGGTGQAAAAAAQEAPAVKPKWRVQWPRAMLLLKDMLNGKVAVQGPVLTDGAEIYQRQLRNPSRLLTHAEGRVLDAWLAAQNAAAQHAQHGQLAQQHEQPLPAAKDRLRNKTHPQQVGQVACPARRRLDKQCTAVAGGPEPAAETGAGRQPPQQHAGVAGEPPRKRRADTPEPGAHADAGLAEEQPGVVKRTVKRRLLSVLASEARPGPADVPQTRQANDAAAGTAAAVKPSGPHMDAAGLAEALDPAAGPLQAAAAEPLQPATAAAAATATHRPRRPLRNSGELRGLIRDPTAAFVVEPYGVSPHRHGLGKPQGEASEGLAGSADRQPSASNGPHVAAAAGDTPALRPAAAVAEGGQPKVVSMQVAEHVRDRKPLGPVENFAFSMMSLAAEQRTGGAASLLRLQSAAKVKAGLKRWVAMWRPVHTVHV